MKPPVDSLLPPTSKGLPHYSIFARPSSLQLLNKVAASNRQHTWPIPETCGLTSNRATAASQQPLADRPIASHSIPPSTSQARGILLLAAQECQPSLFTIHGGGVLDSPLVLRHESLAALTPISPPPTLPSPTLALPETECDPLPTHDRNRLVSDRHTVTCHSGDGDGDGDGRLFSDTGGPAFDSDVIGLASLQLRSQWEPLRLANIEPAPSPLLVGQDMLEVPLQDVPMSEKWHSPSETISQLSSGLLSRPIMELDGESIPPMGCGHTVDSFGEPTVLFSNPLYCDTPETEISLSLWDPTPSSPPGTQASSILAYPDPYHTSDTDSGTPWSPRPILPPLDIPDAYPSHSAFRTPTGLVDWRFDERARFVSDHDEEDNSVSIVLKALPSNELDVDVLEGLPISSPLPLTQPDAGDILDESQVHTPVKQPCLSPSASLSLEHSILPDIESIGPSLVPPAQSPSPSRRSFTSLPVIDPADEFPPPSSISNPSPPLRTLPGADTDDDLIPPDLSCLGFLPEPAFTIPSQSTSLLLIHDPNDIPPPRSPSPENFDLDMLLDDTTDHDLQKLCVLRKRANAAEHAAWALEVQMLQQGEVHLRAEARRVRKREKERSREIVALLRLKLGPNVRLQAASAGETGPIVGPKKLISSLSQLVARMMFRRHETFRPLANRKSAGTPREYVVSPLSQSVMMGCDGADSLA